MQSAPSSPTGRVKFLCSYGGRILLRPSDGCFKYIGGETRAVVVPRDVTFSELTKKLNAMFEEGLVLKYELVSEDLDTLITVRSDQDIKHMLEQHDRHQAEGLPMFRAFLFPPSLTVVETRTPIDPNDMQTRYIDTINSLTRINLTVKVPPAPNSPTQPFNNISLPCTPPKSPYSILPEPQATQETNPSNPNPNSNGVSVTYSVNSPTCPNHLPINPQPQLYYPTSPFSLSPEPPPVTQETNPSNPNPPKPNPNPNSVSYAYRVNSPTCPNHLSINPQPQLYYPKSPFSLSPEPPVTQETNPSNPNPNPNGVSYTYTVNSPTCPNHLSINPQPKLYYPNPSYRQNLSSYHLPKPPTEKQVSASPFIGMPETGKIPVNQGLGHLYQIVATKWYPRVGGGACGYYINGGMNGYARGDRQGSAPPSPTK